MARRERPRSWLEACLLQEELRRGEAAAEARWAGEVARLQSAEAVLQQRCTGLEAQADAAEARAARFEELAHTLQRELTSKAKSAAWLEEQVGAWEWRGEGGFTSGPGSWGC